MRYFTIFGLVLLTITINASAQLTRNNRCATPDGKLGACVPVKECRNLLGLLQVKPLTEAIVSFLQRSQCGFEGTDPKVCCEGIRGKPRPLATLNVGNSDRPSLDDSEQPADVADHPNLRLLEHNICGPINSGKIIADNRTGLFEIPWMALLAYNTSAPNAEFRCGGTVISKRYVLTAAHCVSALPPNLKLSGVRIGEHNISSERDCEMPGTSEEICADKYQDIGIETVDTHPDFSISRLHNDIALIRLNSDIDFNTQNAKPVCLPIGSASRITSKKLMLSGWGIGEGHNPNPVMRKVNLPVYSQEECASTYRQQTRLWYKQICIGGERGRNSCNGDSGGPVQAPAIYQGNPRYVQYGLLSFGATECASGTFPGVFTRLDHYLEWILDTMTV